MRTRQRQLGTGGLVVSRSMLRRGRPELVLPGSAELLVPLPIDLTSDLSMKVLP